MGRICFTIKSISCCQHCVCQWIRWNQPLNFPDEHSSLSSYEGPSCLSGEQEKVTFTQSTWNASTSDCFQVAALNYVSFLPPPSCSWRSFLFCPFLLSHSSYPSFCSALLFLMQITFCSLSWLLFLCFIDLSDF